MHHFKNDTQTFNHQARPPRHPMCDTRQNQTNKIADYKETIPNRRLTVKRGVFPYAIHANVVSKQENCAPRIPREKVQPTNITGNVFNERRKEFVPPYPTGVQMPPNVAPKNTNKANQNQPQNIPFQNTFHKPSHQSTPVIDNQKPPQGISANFTNSSTTTEMNKNVLLNQYLTQQYEATVKTSTSTSTQLKHITFNVEEAFQICTYQKIGEVINQSLITEGSSNFHSSLEVMSIVQKKLQEVYIERKKSDGKSHTSSRTHTKNVKPTENKHEVDAFKSIPNIHESKRRREHTKTNKPDVYDYFFDDISPKKKYEKPKFNSSGATTISRNLLPENDTLSSWKGNDANRLPKGNDNCLSSRGFKFTKNTNGWQSSITLSSDSENDDFKDAISGNELKESHDIFEIQSPVQKKTDEGDYFKSCFSQPNADIEEGVSPSLFFCDDSPVTNVKKLEQRSQQAPTNHFFSFDSVVAKRSIEPENEKLLNPIEFLKSTVGHSRADKKKRKRKRIKTPNPYYSDSTYYGANPLVHGRKHDMRFHSKVKNHKAKISLHKKQSLYS